MTINTQIAYFDEPLYLESGRIFETYQLAYETYGTLNDDKSNTVLITHALSGSHHAAGLYEGDKKAGWWDDLIGDKKAIDTEKFFVICINNLGSCFGSTSPMSKDKNGDTYRLKFPVLTISDIVKAQINLLASLDIYHLKAVIGGSMGGMQALCYAIEYPTFCDTIIPIATTAYTKAWVIAFNQIAIEAIKSDEMFENGNYDTETIKKNGLKGLEIGRMAGHISYLSHNSMDDKFGRNYVANDGLYELFGRFEIDRYLQYNGYNFSKNFDPLSYLYILKTINIFNAGRNYDSLEESLKNIKTKIHLISFSGDMLFLPSEMREIYDIMCKIGKKDLVTIQEIKSDYGHDAFLVEVHKFDKQIKQLLK